MSLNLISRPLAVVVAAISLFSTDPCKPPSRTTIDSVLKYVGERFHVERSLLSIPNKTRVQGSCFWNLSIEASNPHRALTLYLSPDGKFLFPDIYEISIDPSLAEKAQRDSIAKKLLQSPSSSRGTASAPVTIVEFVDFQCPYCKRMAKNLESLRTNPQTTNQVRLIYRAFPLPMHNWSYPAALLGRCIEKLQPSSFWDYHDFIFANQETLGSADFESLPKNFESILAKTTRGDIEACIKDPATRRDVENDIALGKNLGVDSTPTLFINGEKRSGVVADSELKELIKTYAHTETH